MYLRKNDIEFVDVNIIIPYLYNKINEEDIAKKYFRRNSCQII